MATLQERIKERRTEKGFTLLDLADAIGVKEATMQRYESGEIKNVKHETVVKLAEILNCSPQYLMGWVDIPNDNVYKHIEYEKENNKGVFLMAAIADRIQEGMDLRGLKQVDIIEKTGMNKGALSSYLSGKYKPKQDKIYMLAKALDVSEEWLMGYDVPIERKENFSLQVSKKEKDLLVKFNSLNESGQIKAVEYVSDLADNPKYQKEVNEKEIPLLDGVV